MRSFSAVSIAALLATALAARGAAAQACTPNANSALYPQYGPLALRLSASARSLAMGDVNVAGRDDDVAFYGPAQLAVARGTSMSIERFAQGTVGGAASTVVRFGSSRGIGFGVSGVQYKAPGCVSAPDLGNFASGGSLFGSSAQVVVGAGQALGRYRVGLAARYAEELVPGARLGSLLADVGVSRDFGFDVAPLTVALAVQNIGRDLKPGGAREETPLTTTLGAATGGPVGDFDLGLTGAVSVRRDGFVAPAGGVELAWVWIEGYALAIRAGARRADDGLGAMTAGAGLNADRLSFDYALETLSGSRIAHRIGVRIR